MSIILDILNMLRFLVIIIFILCIINNIYAKTTKLIFYNKNQDIAQLNYYLESTFKWDKNFRIVNKFDELGIIIVELSNHGYLQTLELPPEFIYRNTRKNIFSWEIKPRFNIIGNHRSNTSINYKKMFPKLGANINIFILDTGINLKHPEFQNLKIKSFKKNAFDRNGHGSHVAGIAVGQGSGFAHNSNIFIAKVVDDDGYSDDDSIFFEALNWSVKKCRRGDSHRCIINLSIGGTFDIIQNNLIEHLDNMGVLIIAAAGNNTDDACKYSPSSSLGAFTITSVNIDKVLLSEFSNYGKCVDMAADGENIISAWSTNTYKALSGTSMAAPHVTGLAALIWGENPEFTNHELKWYLINLSKVWIMGYPLSI